MESYGKVASLGQILKDLEFPANKDKIVKFFKSYITNKDILNKLEKIKDKEYKNVAEITLETDLVY